MAFSSLIVGRWPLGTNRRRYGERVNQNTGKRVKVDMFIVHHAAMPRGLQGQFVHPSRELSATYGMTQNGDIFGVLDEALRPFTSSSWKADTRAVTIEIENELGAPSWKISDRAFDQLARLIADVATRHGFPIDRDHVIGHQEVVRRFGQGIATACPGPWLFSRMDELVELARRYQREGAGAPPVQELGDVVVGSVLRLQRWVGYELPWLPVTSKKPELLSGDFEVIGISGGHFHVRGADGATAWVHNSAKAGRVPTEEEEIMGAVDDILKAQAQAHEQTREIIRRESRLRAYERESTGEVMLARLEWGVRKGPYPSEEALRASLPLRGEHQINAQEWERRLRVSDEDWQQILDATQG